MSAPWAPCAVGVYRKGSAGWQVWCREHGGTLSVWRRRDDALKAADRHRALLAA